MINVGLAKRIGSIVLLVGSCFAGELELSVLSSRGIPVSSVSMGKPFFIRVAREGGKPFERAPVVEGLDQVSFKGESYGTNTLSAGSRIFKETYAEYTVVAKELGTVTLGPATIDGMQSNTVTFTVEKDEGYPSPKVALTFDKTEVYPGQKVSFTYRFSWHNPEIRSLQYAPLEGDSFTVKNVRQIRDGKEAKADGKNLYSEEWRGDLYPREVGTVEIGPLAVTYREPVQDEDIFSLFFSSATKNVARAEPVYLTVVPLPETDKKVQAVGTFTDFTACLSDTSAPQHEAVTLVLHLIGEADFENLEVPQLTLPEGVRSYESKTMTSKGSISWVYLLQGFEEGAFTIPPQEFVYFDTAAKNYKTIATKPLELTVTPGKPVHVPELPQEVRLEPERIEEVPLVEHTRLPDIPLWLFILLIILPPLYVLGCWAYNELSPYIKAAQRKWRARSALAHAKKELEALTDYTALYPLLKKALADYYELPDSDEKTLLNVLRKREIDPALIKRLKELLYDLNAVSRFSLQEGDASLLARTKEVLISLSSLVLLIIVVMPLHAATTIEQITGFLGGVPFIVWQLGVLVGWWGLWYGYKKLSVEWRFLLISLWVVIVAAWLIRARVAYRPRGAVTQETQMYVGPGDTYPGRALLTPQDEITLVKKQGKWYYVNSTQGIGWVHEDRVEKKQE